VEECSFCHARVSWQNFPNQGHMSQHNVCKICIERFLEIKILDERAFEIQCPVKDCLSFIDYHEIKASTKHAVFNT
jgi:hypothetical protein